MNLSGLSASPNVGCAGIFGVFIATCACAQCLRLSIDHGLSTCGALECEWGKWCNVCALTNRDHSVRADSPEQLWSKPFPGTLRCVRAHI